MVLECKIDLLPVTFKLVCVCLAINYILSYLMLLMNFIWLKYNPTIVSYYNLFFKNRFSIVRYYYVSSIASYYKLLLCKNKFAS